VQCRVTRGGGNFSGQNGAEFGWERPARHRPATATPRKTDPETAGCAATALAEAAAITTWAIPTPKS
jgi:hypothetical protein